MAKIKNLKDFFVQGLKDLYSAEKQIIKALPKLAQAALSEELKMAFEEHIRMTDDQITRLEKIGKLLGITLTGKKCKAMEGLVKEGQELLEENTTPEVLDVALIAAAQKVEHYEIASYGCAKTYALLLGEKEVEKLLNTTLEEEINTDITLSEIAEELNVVAVEGSDEE